ncbi:MAG: class I SAM-dependent rRNA methyltransferase [Xanthomonadaceae bacterium]|nr:class I SAM-dependent rRNA methyltransferase [Xanthomonadaceae bacterium]
MELKPLILKKNEERRLRAGHLWVYSNEVDTAETPLTGFTPGELVEVRERGGRPVGTGYVNPHSLICARLLSRDAAHPVSRSLILHRVNQALALRERLSDAPFYRLVFGEADLLPGLVVDRYGDHLVVQITTAGMETLRDDILDALDKVVAPLGILLRNDSSARELEGLPKSVEVARGTVPDEAELVEHGTRFRVPLAAGQKTGWFYDQSDNRGRLLRYAAGARVLDVFSYVGAWGIQAARFGASDVLCIDASERALQHAAANAALNDVHIETLQADAFDALKALRAEGRDFDVVVVDPPAFIKRRKDHRAGLDAYRRLNQAAMQLLGKDGILISCSCSHHLGDHELLGMMNLAARHVDRNLQVIETGGQAWDHPIHPAIPETRYLKAIFARVFM